MDLSSVQNTGNLMDLNLTKLFNLCNTFILLLCTKIIYIFKNCTAMSLALRISFISVQQGV